MQVSFKYLLLAFFLIFFYVPLLDIKKKDEEKTIKIKYLIITLPFFLIYTLTLLTAKNVYAIPLAIAIFLGGLISYKIIRKSIWVKLILSISICFLFYILYPKYTSEIVYQKSLINKSLINDINLKATDSSNIRLNLSGNKLTVLEFWNSACAQCIKDFPKFQDFYNTSKMDYNIYSVNVPIDRDRKNSFSASKLMDSLGYDFPVLFGNKKIMNQLEVQAFPTVIIISDNIVKYKGHLNYAGKGKYNFKTILEKIKNDQL